MRFLREDFRFQNPKFEILNLKSHRVADASTAGIGTAKPPSTA
jgi:hypothetical protein